MSTNKILEKVIEGERFDSPLILPGFICAEPERYIAEKPFELTKFEFSVLRRPVTSELVFSTLLGATIGIVITVGGKLLSALLERKMPTLEVWELWAIGLGAVATIVAWLIPLPENEKERRQLEKVINGHFKNSKPRRVHLTQTDEQ